MRPPSVCACRPTKKSGLPRPWRRRLTSRRATPLPGRRAATGIAASSTLPAPAAPSANVEGRFSLSRQLGLGINRIVIDPGHGGHDPGTQGTGLSEAELVLDVARRLEMLLLKEPGVEVMLTRRTDVFVPLEERTAIANRAGRGPVPVDSRQLEPEQQGRRRRDLLPELRVEPRRRGRGRARELGLGPHDAQPARHREGDHAEQQAGRVARLRHAGAARDGRDTSPRPTATCATAASSRRRLSC